MSKPSRRADPGRQHPHHFEGLPGCQPPVPACHHRKHRRVQQAQDLRAGLPGRHGRVDQGDGQELIKSRGRAERPRRRCLATQVASTLAKSASAEGAEPTWGGSAAAGAVSTASREAGGGCNMKSAPPAASSLPKETMMSASILVAYATKHGSAREVAEAIGGGAARRLATGRLPARKEGAFPGWVRRGRAGGAALYVPLARRRDRLPLAASASPHRASCRYPSSATHQHP
jgi:hypothetical protein